MLSRIEFWKHSFVRCYSTVVPSKQVRARRMGAGETVAAVDSLWALCFLGKLNFPSEIFLFCNGTFNLYSTHSTRCFLKILFSSKLAGWKGSSSLSFDKSSREAKWFTSRKLINYLCRLQSLKSVISSWNKVKKGCSQRPQLTRKLKRLYNLFNTWGVHNQRSAFSIIIIFCLQN